MHTWNLKLSPHTCSHPPGESCETSSITPNVCHAVILHLRAVYLVWFCRGFSCIHYSFWILMCHTCNKCVHTRTQTLWVSELWQPVISFNPFIMFLFSFPLFGGKKVNANRNSGTLRKTHSLRLRKQEQGVFGKRDTYVRTCAWLFNKKMKVCIGHVTVLHACLCERGVWSLCCLRHMLTGKQRSHWPAVVDCADLQQRHSVCALILSAVWSCATVCWSYRPCLYKHFLLGSIVFSIASLCKLNSSCAANNFIPR